MSSNPYGGGYQPYEPPPQNPYGGSTYEGPNPYADGGAPRTDGVSIAAFVCSLTCCAAPVGIALGIAGIVRTKDGTRSGRWAAVAGLAVGAIATVAMVVTFVALFWFGSNTVFEDEARVGQCIDVSGSVGSRTLWQQECDEPHDAEVVAAGDFDDKLVRRYEESSVEGFCTSLITEPRYREVGSTGDYAVDVSTDAFDDDDPDPGDAFVCFFERADGKQITGPLG